MPVRDRLLQFVDLVPILAMVFISFFFSKEVPASDDWDLVPVINHMIHGSLDWTVLDTPYAGHKIDVPYLLLSEVAVLTHWNTWVFRILNILLFVGAWAAIRPLAASKGRLLTASLMFWSWNQWVAWIFTAAMYCTMAIFCLIWSVRLLSSSASGKFLFGSALAVLATFCQGAGLAVWPAGLFLIFMGKRPIWQRFTFVIIFLFAIAAFLHHPPVHQSMISEYSRGSNIFHMPIFFLIGLGAPLGFPTLGISAILALLGLLLLAAGTQWRELIERPYPAALLIASLAMMSMVMIARGGGPDLIGGANSRYGTIPALFWTMVVILVETGSWKYATLIGLIFCSLVRDISRIPSLNKYNQDQMTEIRGLLDWTQGRQIMIGAQTPPAQFDEDARLLQQWHYSLFKNEDGGSRGLQIQSKPLGPAEVNKLP